jgi:hypothetical protein
MKQGWVAITCFFCHRKKTSLEKKKTLKEIKYTERDLRFWKVKTTRFKKEKIA